MRKLVMAATVAGGLLACGAARADDGTDQVSVWDAIYQMMFGDGGGIDSPARHIGMGTGL